ncbi:hypothetical protein [Micromonospora echinospora]|uniref:hypothetical protein n=1 Tax=Micromonospora echinospora TaxID=1877 RepID=UPI00366E3CBA
MTTAVPLATTRTAFEAIALVDVFNVGPWARTDRDYEDLVELIGELVRRALPDKRESAISEVECRLYGGFTNRVGDPTEQMTRLRRQLRKLGGLKEGVRILPSIAQSLACLPFATLAGTYKNGGQKMVDQMLAQDALFFARLKRHDVAIVIADDDDYLPAMLTVGAQTGMPLRWLRRRPSAINDVHLARMDVKLLADGAWR